MEALCFQNKAVLYVRAHLTEGLKLHLSPNQPMLRVLEPFIFMRSIMGRVFREVRLF